MQTVFGKINNMSTKQALMNLKKLLTNKTIYIIRVKMLETLLLVNNIILDFYKKTCYYIIQETSIELYKRSKKVFCI